MQARLANIASLFLAKALGLAVAPLVESYTYVASASHVFPNHSTNGGLQCCEHGWIFFQKILIFPHFCDNE